MSARGLVLKVDLSAILESYKYLCALGKDATTAAVVKADAYGLGADIIAPLLYQHGCRNFFVARIGEAIRLAPLLKGARIYILDGVSSTDDLEHCRANDLIPILNSRAQIETYKKTPCPVALHIDTGMNRLGIRPDEIDFINLNELDLKLLMSHAACADDDDDEMTGVQFSKFQKIRKQFPDIPASFCNSAATIKYPEMHCDLTRPGIALYGGIFDMKPAVSLSAPIRQIRSVTKGDTIGYGATYTADQDMTVATVGIGYADGLFRSLSNTGKVFVNNHACPILGRVSMDLLSIDISKIDKKDKLDSEVEILGKNQSISELAQDAETISYEVITTLGKTIEKCYLNSTSI